MKRKVIRQGHNTLTITLPAKWVEKNGIKAGEEVEIEEKGTSIVINSISSTKDEKTTIDISDFDVALAKVIYSLYKKGYDEIELHSTNPDLLNNVQKIILEIVVGFEVVSHSKHMCTIRSVVGMSREEFMPMMRRIFLHLHAMEEGIINSITTKDVGSLQTFRQMESLNNRYTGFCRRMLNKFGIGEEKNGKMHYCLIEFLEKIADEYKFLCDYLLENPKEMSNVSKDSLNVLKRLSTFSRGIERLYYKFEVANYLEIYRERKNIVKEINAAFPDAKRPNNVILHYCLCVVQFYIDIANFVLTMNL